jgi:hypothetical protein
MNKEYRIMKWWRIMLSCRKMLICDNVVQECDARDDDSSNAAGKQNTGKFVQ